MCAHMCVVSFTPPLPIKFAMFRVSLESGAQERGRGRHKSGEKDTPGGRGSEPGIEAFGLQVFISVSIEIRHGKHLLESLIDSEGSISCIVIVASVLFDSTNICLVGTLGLPLLLILKI